MAGLKKTFTLQKQYMIYRVLTLYKACQTTLCHCMQNYACWLHKSSEISSLGRDNFTKYVYQHHLCRRILERVEEQLLLSEVCDKTGKCKDPDGLQ